MANSPESPTKEPAAGPRTDIHAAETTPAAISVEDAERFASQMKPSWEVEGTPAPSATGAMAPEARVPIGARTLLGNAPAGMVPRGYEPFPPARDSEPVPAITAPTTLPVPPPTTLPVPPPTTLPVSAPTTLPIPAPPGGHAFPEVPALAAPLPMKPLRESESSFVIAAHAPPKRATVSESSESVIIDGAAAAPVVEASAMPLVSRMTVPTEPPAASREALWPSARKSMPSSVDVEIDGDLGTPPIVTGAHRRSIAADIDDEPLPRIKKSGGVGYLALAVLILGGGSAYIFRDRIVPPETSNVPGVTTPAAAVPTFPTPPESAATANIPPVATPPVTTPTVAASAPTTAPTPTTEPSPAPTELKAALVPAATPPAPIEVAPTPPKVVQAIPKPAPPPRVNKPVKAPAPRVVQASPPPAAPPPHEPPPPPPAGGIVRESPF